MELFVEADEDSEEFEVGCAVAAAACIAASFSNFLMRASCCRSDIGVCPGTEVMLFVDDDNDVGDDPLLLKRNKYIHTMLVSE